MDLHVGGDLGVVLSESLSNDPFESVPVVGFPVFFGYSDPQLRMPISSNILDGNHLATKATPISKHLLKMISCQDSKRFRKCKA